MPALQYCFFMRAMFMAEMPCSMYLSTCWFRSSCVVVSSSSRMKLDGSEFTTDCGGGWVVDMADDPVACRLPPVVKLARFLHSSSAKIARKLPNTPASEADQSQLLRRWHHLRVGADRFKLRLDK